MFDEDLHTAIEHADYHVAVEADQINLQAREVDRPGAGRRHIICIPRPLRGRRHLEVSWLPHRLMDRNAAITSMTLADLVSEGEGTSPHDDPRWAVVDALALPRQLRSHKAENGRLIGLRQIEAFLAGSE